MQRLAVIWAVTVAAFGLAVQLGCGSGRTLPTTNSSPPVYTYVDDIQQILQVRCVSCHGDREPQGNHRLNSWPALIGPGSTPLPKVTAGNPGSPLLMVLRGSHSSLLSAHEASILTHWVVEDELAYSRSSFHPRDWVLPGTRDSLSFHGGKLRANNWDDTECKQCHGADLGEAAGNECYSCHPLGPLGTCATCHGALVSSGLTLSSFLPSGSTRVHQLHANPQVGPPLACSECHLVPNSALDDGHLFDNPAARQSDLRAEVTFGAKARLNGVVPYYDPQSGACTVYCHGAGISFGGPPPTPAANPGPARCSFCHSIAKHGKGANCNVCHAETVMACAPGSDGCFETGPGVGVMFPFPRRHIDGRAPYKLTAGEAPCHTCHGTLASRGAPPPDTSGSHDVNSVSVGMHRIHVSDGPLRVGIPCETCHVVPKTVGDPGHLDNTPGAEVRFNDLANHRRYDASCTLPSFLCAPVTTVMPVWDRKTKTCTNVYCHSRPGGTHGAVWTWTKKIDPPIHCTSCHRGWKHYAQHVYCPVCHLPAFVDFRINPATHMNGRLDWTL